MLAIVDDITEMEQSKAQIERDANRLEKTLKDILHAVANMVEMRDPYTAGHQRNVGLIAETIAKEMGWKTKHCDVLELMGLVYDIGKRSVPAEILSKPARLSVYEMEIVKQHVENGYCILKDIDFDYPVAEVVRQHHERLDGSGYPRGLKAHEILPETRIIMVADVLESMASHRPYRPALGVEAAIKELVAGKGRRYDAEVVDTTVALIRENRLGVPWPAQ